MANDNDNEDLLKVLSKNFRLVCADSCCQMYNLESCGIVGDQLAMLFKRQPRIFTRREATLRNLVSKVFEKRFKMNSMMFVLALIAISCCGVETIEKKVETFKMFGFSKDEYNG